MDISQAQQLENTSGMGKDSVVPEGVRGWSWGAFLLNFIWGIGNNVYIALLCLIPVVNLVMMVVLGFKGREWAWRKRRWISVEEFRKTQKRWGIAGACLWVFLIFGFPLIMQATLSGQKSVALKAIRQIPKFSEVLGEPITTGWFLSGTLRKDMYSSCAIVEVPVFGSKTSGMLRMASVKEGADWLPLSSRLVTDAGEEHRAEVSNANDYLALLKPCMK